MVEEIAAALQRFAATGTVMLVEQHLDLALAIADRVMVLDRGQIALDRPTAELAGRDDIERLLTF